MASSEQEILQRLQDQMVVEAEQIVRALNLKHDQGISKGRTQASRAIEVAQGTDSLAVFINWLRYQAGRERSSEFWSRTVDQQSLAVKLTLTFGEFHRRIAEALDDETDPLINPLTMRAVIRFLGYFRRALIGSEYLDAINLEAIIREGKRSS